jgi:hypothetical protein
MLLMVDDDRVSLTKFIDIMCANLINRMQELRELISFHAYLCEFSHIMRVYAQRV